MERKREEMEKWESKSLAPYAQLSAESRGRQHEEETHPTRTQFQRDRDRIIHSRAFRRLEYKSQVFVHGTDDHYRTRLTHTIEVAAVARTLARSLRLNEDLAEAISLAHDLGHPPFGHAGEQTLDQLLKNHGGFDHNQQSLRVVEELELKYPQFNGLNLSWEVLEGLAKPHRAHSFSKNGREKIDFLQPSLEAQIADIADEITYVCHDLDDGLNSGLLREKDLSDLALWKRVEIPALEKYPRLENERRRGYILRSLLNFLVEDVVEASTKNIEKATPSHVDAVRKEAKKLIAFSPEIYREVQTLRAYLMDHLYEHAEVKSVKQKACRCLEELYALLVTHPHLLSTQFSLRIKKEGIERATCNYLACMTDRFALQQHEKLIGKNDNRLEQTKQPTLL